MDAEERTPKVKFPKMGMAKIIIISLVLSLIVNFTYLAIETISVKSGKSMPIQKVVYGGDCMEYVGIYWSVLSLEPALPADEPYISTEPIPSFSLFRLLRCIAVLAFAVWAILAAINRYFKVLLILIGGMACIYLLLIGVKRFIEYWNDMPMELCSVVVITSDIHPGVYNGIKYPKQASYLVLPGDGNKYGYSENESMQNCVSPEEVPKKQLRALIKAAKDIRKKTNSNRNSDFAYRIKILYKTRDGYKNVQILGYESFPEGWEVFIHILNEACGMNYLREKPEMVKYSQEWFCDTYGISDRDMPEGATVEQFLNTYRIDMSGICGMNKSSWDYQCFEPERLLKDYLFRTSEETLLGDDND